MRSPFTGVVFAIELTHDFNMLLPLLLACIIAHGFTVLALRRAILAEKVARRGFHLSREYVWATAVPLNPSASTAGSS
jgi:CIC family chloride channel protein